MQLIGMLDSPYVRRAAISLRLLDIPYEHRSISVFSTFAKFQAINPVVKAPSLVCDDGEVLMDSTLILDLAESLARPGLSLMPSAPAERQQALVTLGLALAACEKGVQIVYEHNVRPAEKLHEPWVARVSGQLHAACGALESRLLRQPLALAPIRQDGVTTAVVWHFLRALLPDLVSDERYPALAAFSAQAEQLPAFAAAPHSDRTCSYSGQGG